MLKALELGQQLTKKEMKEIKGGGTCCWHTSDWSEQICDISRSEARRAQGELGGLWCCASCPKQ